MIEPSQFRLPDSLTDLLARVVAASENDLEGEVRILLYQALQRALAIRYI